MYYYYFIIIFLYKYTHNNDEYLKHTTTTVDTMPQPPQKFSIWWQLCGEEFTLWQNMLCFVYVEIGILDDFCKIYGSEEEFASAGETVPLY